jgi:hypothetical protein
MHISVIEPFGQPALLQVANPYGYPLGRLLQPYTGGVAACVINGQLCPDWETFVPQEDRIELYLEAGFFAGGVLLGSSTLATLVSAAIVAVATTALSMLLQYAVGAMTGKDPGSDSGRVEEVFGIAGLTNTTALGTPKMIVYGERRVYGHIIGTTTRITSDGRQTAFSILYFMGMGEMHSMSEVLINDTPLSSFEGANIGTRMGTADQTAFTEFPAAAQVYSDGRGLPMDPSTITYTTLGTQVDELQLTLSIPYLFNIEQKTGNRKQTKVIYRVEYRTAGVGGWTEAPGSPDTWTGLSQSALYRPFTIDLPSQGQWDVRLRAMPVSGGTNEGEVQPSLYNVEERTKGTNAYPNCALLAVHGVASAQIESFESIRASALVQGAKVDIWTGLAFVNAWTQNRAWILRDMLVHPSRGLGHRIDPSLFDDEAALVAASYWAEQISGFDGEEDRDHCDLILNERRPGWDWIREVLGEGNAAMILSGGKLKLVLDHAKTPNLLYAVPGNIVEGTLEKTDGGEGAPPNVMHGEYPDENNRGQLNVIEVSSADIGIDTSSELVRDETMTLRTIVRESQARRKLAYVLSRKRLIQKRWTWVSPQGAMVSEPFDVDSLSYLTLNTRRGFSGFTPAGSTTSLVPLDRLVTLQAATTYELIVRHLSDNSTERRTVATAAGVWGAVAPTLALSAAPVEGDLWAIGQANVHIIQVLIESVKEQDDGTYQVQASEYNGAIYTPPTLPALPSYLQQVASTTPESGALPLPLSNATVTTYAQYGPDGSWVGKITCSVSPGQAVRAGIAQAGAAATLTLDASEPAIDGYYTSLPADLTILAGTGVGQTRRISAQTGLVVTVSTAWEVEPDSTSAYEIRWGTHDGFKGFDVEMKVTDEAEYSAWATFEGYVGTLVAAPVAFDGAIRLVPYGQKNARNRLGLWEIDFVAAEDTRVPEPVTGFV